MEGIIEQLKSQLHIAKEEFIENALKRRYHEHGLTDNIRDMDCDLNIIRELKDAIDVLQDHVKT